MFDERHHDSRADPVPSSGLAVIEDANPPSSASEASREGRQRPHVLFSYESAPLLSLRSKVRIRCSPRFRRCSNATTSVHRRLWPSVDSVGAGHSEPPVKGSRLRSLEPLWDLFLHVPTQKQEAPSAPSEGRGGPSAVGRSSSLLTVSVLHVDRSVSWCSPRVDRPLPRRHLKTDLNPPSRSP